MAAGDIALNIIINASAGNVSGVVGQVGQALSGLAGGAGGLGMIVGAGAAAAGALVTVGGEAVKAAGNFQQMTSTLVTSAGESAANLDKVRQGILDISTSTGTSVEQLAGAMYQIESSGQHGAAGLDVLKVAAQGAKSENADLTTVSKALTTVLTDYHMPASDAASAMNGLIVTVQNGKTTLEQLSSAMGAVLPNASALHISFPQVAGSLATMTNAGMSARQAAQNLNNVLIALSAPGAKAEAAMKGVGLSAQQVKDALANQGLPEALQLIEDHVGKKFPANSVEYQQALKAILGGLTGLKVANMLTGDSLKTTEDNIKKIAAAMHMSTGEVLGWDVAQANFNTKIDQAKAALNAFMIVLGTKLLPLLAPIVGGIGEFISNITKLIGGMDTAGGSSKALGGALGGLTVAGNYLKDIFGLIGQAVSTVFGHDFKQASTFVGSFAKDAIGGLNSVLFTIDELLNPIVNKLLPAFLKLGDAVGGGIMTAFNAFAGIIGGDLSKNFSSLDKSASGLVPIIEGMADAMNKAADYVKQLQPVFQDLGTFMGNTFKPVLDQLVTTFNSQVKPAWEQFVAAIGPAMPALKLIAEIIGVVLILALKGLAQFLASTMQVGIIVFGALVSGALGFATGILNALGFAVQAWDALKNAWNAAPGFFSNIWNTVKKAFSDAWNWISSQAGTAWKAVQNAWGAAGKWFQDIGHAIQQAIGDAWKWIQQQSQKSADSMWKQVGTTFSNAWNTYISKPLSTLAGNIGNWFTTQSNNVKTWATNMMKQFAAGITAGVTNVTTAITNLGNSIAKLLGFHSPPASGPLATSDQWMPNMMKMFASGITAGVTTVTNAITQVAQKIADFLKHTSPAKSGPLAGDDKWMPNMMNMFAQGITQNTPKVTNAVNTMALKVKTAFNTINTNVNTDVNNINSKINLLSTNLSGKTSQISTQFSTLNSSVQTATDGMNKNIQLLNTTTSTAFLQIGKDSQQASTTVSTTSSQMSTSVSQSGSQIAQTMSQTRVIIGNTSQYSTQTVSVMDQNTQTINKNLDQMKGHNEKITQDIIKAIHNVAEGDGIGAMQKFVDAVKQFGQAAVNQAKADAAAIANLLGHTKPKEGPLRDDDLWGKHMIENIVGGMQNAMPLLAGTTDAIAGTLASVGIGPRASLSVGGRVATPGNNQPMVIYNVLDGKKISKVVTSYQTRELRVQGVVRGS